MAVAGEQQAAGASGRRLAWGANVFVASALVIGIAGILQVMAYQAHAKWDMTSAGINSLSAGTENLLRNLETDVRLTSLYFKTDLEDEDQQRYRRAADDLLGLYASTNRGKITAEWINPLSDHEKMKKLSARLREIPAFKEEWSAYKTRVDEYFNVLDAQMRRVVQTELEQLGAAGTSMDDPAVQKTIGPVVELLNNWVRELDATRQQVDALVVRDDALYAAAVQELKNTYRDFAKALNEIAAYGRKNAAGLAAAQAEWLKEAGGRFADVVSAVEGESAKLNELKPLKLDEIERELQPNSNAILVETPTDARIVDFPSTWPPMDQNAGGRRIAFKDRAFKGEEKLTAAILRTAHKEQTAVLFVRFGGAPLFFGGFLPGQPQAAFAQVKQQLEDANFLVEEWDLKTKDTIPEITPKPTRTIFVVLKPTPPERGPMGQPGQEPPISESQKKVLLDAIDAGSPALFIAGWTPGPFPGGMIPSTYEWNDHLSKNWGITVDPAVLLLQTTSVQPGKYAVTRRDWFVMRDIEVGNHDVVRGPHARRLAFPWCAPLVLASPPPEGVEYHKLVVQPKFDGVWGVKDIQAYENQQQEDGFLHKAPNDTEGPFDLAVAAQKGDRKVVVVSSRDFATDQIAFASELAMTSQGLSLRSRNPGNVGLLANALHWLNDNTKFLDIGRPVETSVLAIEKTSTERMVQALTIFVWPALALVCGGIAWWVRRR
jgi:uncharacterized protein YneR